MKQTPTTFLFIFALNLLTLQSSFGQQINFDFNAYAWSSKPAKEQIDTADKGNSTIFFYNGKFLEYKYNEKSENLEEYYLSHVIKYLNDDKAVEDNNKIYVSVNGSQKIISIKTRVISKGNVVFEASEKEFIEVEEEGRKYNMLALKKVEKGVTIETIIKYQLYMELYGDEYLQLESPIKKSEFTLITPSNLEFKAKTYNGYGKIIDSIADKRRFSFATQNNIPIINSQEKYALTNANKMRVEYTYFQNAETKKKYAKWPELGRMFFDRIYSSYEKNEKDADKIIAKIGLQKYKTEEEKIFAIENFIKTNIAIQKGADEDVFIADILKRKYCTAYHMNQLFAQVFRKSGISFELILSCDKSYKRFDPEFDSWSYLNDVLLYFPNLKKFIDPQEQFLRLGFINTEYLGQFGLFIKSIQIGDAYTAMANVKLIPANDYKSSIDHENYTVTFDKTIENCAIEYNREMNGYGEQGLKAAYYVSPEDNRKKFMEDFIKGLATDAKVSEMKVLNTNITSMDEVNQPLTILAKLSTNHYLEPAGEDKFLFKVGELIGQQAEIYQDKVRQNMVDIDFAHSYERTITILLPNNFTCKGLEKLNINLEFKNDKNLPSYGFVSGYQLEGNKLIVKCTEYYNELTYPKDQFDSFKKVINAAADFNKISILLVKNK